MAPCLILTKVSWKLILLMLYFQFLSRLSGLKDCKLHRTKNPQNAWNILFCWYYSLYDILSPICHKPGQLSCIVLALSQLCKEVSCGSLSEAVRSQWSTWLTVWMSAPTRSCSCRLLWCCCKACSPACSTKSVVAWAKREEKDQSYPWGCLFGLSFLCYQCISNVNFYLWTVKEEEMQ